MARFVSDDLQHVSSSYAAERAEYIRYRFPYRVNVEQPGRETWDFGPAALISLPGGPSQP
jgi:hypothetical protein